MSHGVQMENSRVQLNDQDIEASQPCTQDGMETINLCEEVGATSVANTLKTRFQPKEDELLIQSWLNISKDPIVGNGQRGGSFWKRIGEVYNNHRDKDFQERKPVVVKGRWHKKINPSISKFVGCYKDVVALKKSGASESNNISAAKDIYYQDVREKFTLENAWKLLRDEPKWLAGCVLEPSAKGTNNLASGAYSASSNPPTPTSEYNPPQRPIGQKAAKKKGKEKPVEMSTPKFDALKDDFNKRLELMSGFARDYARIESEKLEIERKRVDAELQRVEDDRKRSKINDLQILTKDTSNMNPRQLNDYDFLYDVIREKYGLN
ncbi:glutathione S-transferase T3 [Medicago truncatula]|uniref:No-apical-meristem-associated carboxy-terminal domain protein n=1 Tax=Medicago truncatula TaxID=3880 RepID=G7JIQ3_MEDTR|nr:glutathione S-transferase T3 [Medicago truncatula]AES90043.2 no-apical-meristem-associated carboxy-terminal domain protein [Medicago truncatula]